MCCLPLPHQVQPKRNVLLQAPEPLPTVPQRAQRQRGRQTQSGRRQQERQVAEQGSASSNSRQGERSSQRPTQVGVPGQVLDADQPKGAL